MIGTFKNNQLGCAQYEPHKHGIKVMIRQLSDAEIVARYKATVQYKEEAAEKLKMKQKALFSYYELHKDEINEWIEETGFNYKGELCHEPITTNSKI